jgi:arabinogalactan oligomer/maltooligosaccharide transport system substrate-binding protein
MGEEPARIATTNRVRALNPVATIDTRASRPTAGIRRPTREMGDRHFGHHRERSNTLPMKRQIRLAGLLMGVVIAAAACTTGTASTAPSEAPASAAPTEAASGAPESQAPATLSGALTLWHSYGSSGGNAEFKAFSRIVEGIQAANPELDLTILEVPFSDLYTKFETESAAGGGPDMFIGPNDSLGGEARGAFLVDLTGKIDPVLAETNEVSTAGSQVDGKIFMVPESLKAVAMYYDSEAVPTAPATMDELLTWVQGGGKLGVLTGAYFGWGFYSAFGGAIFNEDGSCAATATTGVADALKFVNDLKAAGALVDSDYAKVNDAFLNKEIDVMFNGNWTLGDYRAARPALAVGPMPAGPGGVARTMTGVDGWYINAASANQDLAIAVASLLVSKDSQTVEVDVAGHVPANTGISIIDPLVASFSDAINAGDARPQREEMNNYWGNFDKAWADVLTAGADPTAAVAEACAAMDTANGK